MFANGSGAAPSDDFGARGASAWTSDTTGTRCGAVCATGWVAGARFAALLCVSGGSGACLTRAGALRSGKAMAGTDSAGSGVVVAGSVG